MTTTATTHAAAHAPGTLSFLPWTLLLQSYVPHCAPESHAFPSRAQSRPASACRAAAASLIIFCMPSCSCVADHLRARSRERESYLLRRGATPMPCIYFSDSLLSRESASGRRSFRSLLHGVLGFSPRSEAAGYVRMLSGRFSKGINYICFRRMHPCMAARPRQCRRLRVVRVSSIDRNPCTYVHAGMGLHEQC